MDETLGKIAQAGKIYYGESNKKPRESYYEYFLRTLISSKKGELHKLLLCCNAPNEQIRDEIISDWEKAQKETKAS
jgi:hypothetical protein